MYILLSYNLLSFFVSIEGATLCLYVLSGLKTTNRLSIEAGLKYFLMGAFSTGVMLLGIAFLLLLLEFFITNSNSNYCYVSFLVLSYYKYYKQVE